MTALPKLSDPCRKAISERAAAGSPPAPGTREFAYGPDLKQRLDLVKPAGAATRTGAVVRPWWRLVDRRQGTCCG